METLLTKRDPAIYDFDQDPDTIEFIFEYITTPNRYLMERQILLNEYPRITIDYTRANQWLNALRPPRLAEAARKFLNNMKVITFEELFKNLEITADIVYRSGVYENSVILLSSYGKSGHGFGLLFAAYMYGRYSILPRSFMKYFINAYLIYGNDVTYLDIDDMAYTGSQTRGTLIKMNKLLNWGFHKSETHNAIRNAEYLRKNHFDYRIIRFFVTNLSLKLLDSTGRHNTLLPNTIVYSEIISNFNEIRGSTDNGIIEEYIDYLLFMFLLNLGCQSATIVHLEHKVADIASMASFPLLSGYVPSSNIINAFLDNYINGSDFTVDNLYQIIGNKKLFDRIMNGVRESLDLNGKVFGPQFIPFLSNCGVPIATLQEIANNEIEFHETYGILTTDEDDDEVFNATCEHPSINEVIRECNYEPFYRDHGVNTNLMD